MALWACASDWTGPQRAGAKLPTVAVTRRAREALLRQQNAEDAYTILQGLIGDGALNDATFRGQVLAVMRAIDEAYYLVHPRAVVAPPSSGVRHALPRWLRAARDERLLTGFYADQDGKRLIPRGPLLRGARHPTASSADSLADRFAALTVAASVLDQDGRQIPVSVRTIPAAVARGVAPGLAPGAESIAFVPIAEAADDIQTRQRETEGQGWVDFKPSANVDAQSCILHALTEAGAIDLAIAPEFMVSEEHADQLAQALSTTNCAARLLVAGSGATRQNTNDQPWNEARSVNSSGAELWRQRKLWPAGLDKQRAKDFGLIAPPTGTLLYEDISGGAELIVADIDGLGRCVILICQDLQAQLLAEQLMIQYQPDWVFAPLLDSGVGENRWMHRRAFALSALSQTRFVIVSSTSLAAKAGYSDPACAMAIGPQEPHADGGGEIPRAFQIAKAGTRGAARVAIIQWRGGRWLSSTLGAK